MPAFLLPEDGNPTGIKRKNCLTSTVYDGHFPKVKAPLLVPVFDWVFT
jgi:hypothetical protein